MPREILSLLRKKWNLPKEKPINRAIHSFTPAERTIFYISVVLFVVNGFLLSTEVSNAFLEKIPTSGGTLVEGIVGNPRFINPVLALSDADKNMTALVYSGLMRLDENGRAVPDLAESVSLSEDKLTYRAVLREGAHFQDGTIVTADDIVFTISKIADPLIKSPRKGNWEGVTIEKIDEKTVSFRLKKPYTPFIYNLSIGILPKEIWKNVTADEFTFSQFNTLPIGSGPYKVSRVERNSGGIPDYYELESFDSGTGKPFIKKLVLRFYSSEAELADAYGNGDVESVGGLSAENLLNINKNGAKVLQTPLPRVFALFFNQSKSAALRDQSVRLALRVASPKERIIEEVFGGNAKPISGPLPAGLYPWTTEIFGQPLEERVNAAAKILESAGWKKGPSGILEKKSGSETIKLSFSISTGDAPELRAAAELLKAVWQPLGIEVKILTFESGELNQSVIRTRQFDALLFGELVGREADLYPFWHSSQRTDPGLNIALYANSKADKLLEEARVARNLGDAEESMKAFYEEVARDAPAIFLYTPNFVYILPEKVKSAELSALGASHERFSTIREWYIETDRVWKIFLN
ncbi:MAG TPA: peptide ABC transporter substrate-binding protein [Candidatus Paceibacterota bacterium]